MPHKFAVAAHCATLSETSRLFGAVSVIRRKADGSWHGDSQDGASFVRAQIDQGATVAGARALLIGAGGAGSAIAIALLDAGLGELIVHVIDEGRMASLVRLLNQRNRGMVKAGPPDPTGCDLLCHATNLGMAAGDPLPVAAELLTPGIFVGDVIAGHGETALIRAARHAGCRTATGDDMVRAVQGMMVDYLLRL
jgi:shikimate dehydrogenase